MEQCIHKMLSGGKQKDWNCIKIFFIHYQYCRLSLNKHQMHFIFCYNKANVMNLITHVITYTNNKKTGTNRVENCIKYDTQNKHSMLKLKYGFF